MFDIGFWELALIGMLALVVLGPKRLPQAARTAGLWIGRLRAFITNVKLDINRELRGSELGELRKLKEELNQTRQLIEESSSKFVRGLTDSADELERSFSETLARPRKRKSTSKKKRTAGKKLAAANKPATRAKKKAGKTTKTRKKKKSKASVK